MVFHKTIHEIGPSAPGGILLCLVGQTKSNPMRNLHMYEYGGGGAEIGLRRGEGAKEGVCVLMSCMAVVV